ncbi:plasmid mobilization relaxosome protein MobC [Arthrobacter sp. H20]|uniref:plasmid mobilization relaxosome protein MobC n=1 Tax=Arthrobacter sp. H20 TaxID=1267981 RepID=UPI00047A544C|nr:plasmid mobilization relaxosome protein MobC [Arthrobacter sp. H20]
MTEEQSSPRRFGRRRRANISGRTQYVRVSMSEQERAALLVLEERTNRTASEIMVSAALYAENSESLVERRALAIELMQARRLLATVSNNVNQIARHANAGDEFPKDAVAAVAAVRRVADRMYELVDELDR